MSEMLNCVYTFMRTWIAIKTITGDHHDSLGVSRLTGTGVTGV